MDNLCHSLVGAALGKAGLARRTTLGMSTLVIANNLPDLDVAVFVTNTLAVSFRRGWTHGLPAQLTLPLVLTGAMLAYDRLILQPSTRRDASLRPSAPKAKAGELLLLSYLGVLLHVFMDWMNSYGVRLLMPFSGQWFYGDALFIVDPWLYLALGAGWWLSRQREVKGQPHASHPARIGVAIAVIYVGTMLASNFVARNAVRAGLDRAGRPADTRFMVTPVAVNPLSREVIVDVGDRYEKGNLWFEPQPHFRPAGFGMLKGLDDAEAQAALQTPRARAFLRWSRFPFVQVDRNTSPPSIWLNDYRYANAGAYGWSATRIQ